MATDDLVSVLKEIANALNEKNSPKEKEIKRGDVSLSKLFKEIGKGFKSGGIKGAASAFGKFAKGLSPVTAGLSLATLAIAGFSKAAKIAADYAKKTSQAFATLGEQANTSNKSISMFGEVTKSVSEKFANTFEGLANFLGNIAQGYLYIFNENSTNSARGISNQVSTNIEAGLVSGFYSKGFGYSSAEALASNRMSIYDILYKMSENGQTYEEIANAFSSNPSVYGFAGDKSAAFDYYLANEKGVYRNYLNDAQLAGYLEEFYSYQAKLYKSGGSKQLSQQVEKWTELGNAIKQAGDNLYSFDEVISNTAKSTEVTDYAFLGGKLINGDESLKKSLEKESKAIKLYESALEALNGSYIDVAEWLMEHGNISYADAIVRAQELLEMDKEAAAEAMVLYSSGEYSIDQAISKIEELIAVFGPEKTLEFVLRYRADVDGLNVLNNYTPGTLMYNAIDKDTLIDYDKATEPIKNQDIKNAGILRKSAGSAFSTTPAALRGISGFASGGIVGTDQIARIGEGNRKEAVIPLESQSGINFLSQALEQAGGAKTEVHVSLNGQILEMNGYNVRKLGNKLASIIDNETIRRG